MGMKKTILFTIAAFILTTGQVNAGIIYSNNFSGGTAWDFTGASKEVRSPDHTQTFLGVLDKGETADLTLTDLAPHSMVTVSFDLYALRSLDDPGTPFGPDYFKFSFNGTQLVNGTFGWWDNSSTPGYVSSDPDCFGWGYFDGGESTYHFTFNIPDSSPEIDLAFTGETTQPWMRKWPDEGYGIDNLVVSTDGDSASSAVIKNKNRGWLRRSPQPETTVKVPEPAAAVLLAIALLGAGLLSLRARKQSKAE